MYIHIKHIYFNMKIKLVERIENYLIIFTRQADGNTAKKKLSREWKINLTITLHLLFTTDNMCIFYIFKRKITNKFYASYKQIFLKSSSSRKKKNKQKTKRKEN